MFPRKVAYPDFKQQMQWAPRSAKSAAAIEAARGLAVELRARAHETEALRRLPADIVERMGHAGFWIMGAPDAVGGGALDYPAQFYIMEELSTGDPSAGWCVLTHLAGAVLSARLPLPAAKRLHAGAPTIIAGSPVPSGRAIRTDGGYRILDGTWGFASNSGHATHLLGGFQLVSNDSEPAAPFPPDLTKGGRMPIMKCAYLTLDQGEMLANSADTLGLAATRSGSFTLRSQFVPDDWVFDMLVPGDTLALTGPVGIGGHSAVGLGIARLALEEFYRLAKTKKPRSIGRQGLLADHPVVHDSIAKAEAQLRAARAWFYSVVEDCWARWKQGEKMTDTDYMESELANAYAMMAAREAVQAVFNWSGASAVFHGALIGKCMRDILTASAHMAVQESNFEIYGRALMGQPILMASAFDAANVTTKSAPSQPAAGKDPASYTPEMRASLAVATRFVEAMIAQDIDACGKMMANAIEMETPMGTKVGVVECVEVLNMMKQMGTSPMELPKYEGDTIIAINHAPIGEVKLAFAVAGDKIAGIRPVF
jgi:indole-3-acetate monooxygenase